MDFHETLALLKVVILSPEVIGTAIVILVFLNMVFYIVSYKKRGKREKKKDRRKPVSALSRAGTEGEGGFLSEASGEGDFRP